MPRRGRGRGRGRGGRPAGVRKAGATGSQTTVKAWFDAAAEPAPPLPSTTHHISLHDAAVDARADGVLVRIETLVIGCPWHPILLHHAGSVRVMLDHNSVLPPSHLLRHISVVVGALGVCGGCCSRARGRCDGDEGDESGPPAAHAGQNRPTQPAGTSRRRRRLHRFF